jgi:hypothetical protein
MRVTLFHVEGQMDMMKLTHTFHNYLVNIPNNMWHLISIALYIFKACCLTTQISKTF